jgi:hypothetical protein
MSRPSQKVPAYCRHKASGKAVVRLEGKDHYLGEYGSDESHEAYEKLIAEWRAGKKPSHHSLTCDPCFADNPSFFGDNENFGNNLAASRIQFFACP